MEPQGRKRVGLALGGGVVRGMAHIGVLMALERDRIPIDVVVGTSVGSLIGAIYSTGKSVEELSQLASKVGWRHILRPAWFGDGFFGFSGLERWLVKQRGDLQFADLARPFAAVASDIDSWRRVFLREGRLVTADCLISSAVDHLGYLRFAKRQELIELGQAAAEEKLPEIREALGL